MPIIPGLVKEAYVAGSRHTAGTPELLRANVDGSRVDFAWRAVGSSIYSVTAAGEVKVTGADSCGRPSFDYNSFNVSCSCPDGERQRTQSVSAQKLYVCKHAEASLDSVLDPTATAEVKQKAEAAAAEAKIEAEQLSRYLEEQRKAQDDELPGERQRIVYGLSKRSDSDIVSLVKGAAKTMEGLKALSTIFPTDVMPPQQIVRCGRCSKSYDPQISSDAICCEEHPYDRCKTMWDTSKKSWEHCRRCGKDFNLDGFHSWGKRRRDDPEDEGPYCYETTHVPEEDFDEGNDPIMQALDDSDY